ncbi:MAG: hypothetical protein HC849_22190 [Oscillatoriales cyanobacterium RU_3_3]|nr:hypothetical protein [Oscillatoriales cyanobacterium RU_3_3]
MSLPTFFWHSYRSKVVLLSDRLLPVNIFDRIFLTKLSSGHQQVNIALTDTATAVHLTYSRVSENTDGAAVRVRSPSSFAAPDSSVVCPDRTPTISPLI